MAARRSPPPYGMDVDSPSPPQPRSQDYGFKILHNPDGATLDIIAIHGFDGHREQSWSSDNGKGCWLKDYLPQRLEKTRLKARIITYGYSFTIQQGAELSHQAIYDHASTFLTKLTYLHEEEETERRPMIFLAHSVGGIVLKYALLESHNATDKHRAEVKSVVNSTAGIIFLGTPHTGLEGLGLELSQVLGKIQAVSSQGKIRMPAPQILFDLQRDSSHLQKQLSDFASISCDFDHVFIFETRATRLPDGNLQVLVTKATALVQGAVDATTMGFERDHLNLIKFDTDDDEDFKQIVSFIRRMNKKAGQRVADKWLDSR